MNPISGSMTDPASGPGAWLPDPDPSGPARPAFDRGLGPAGLVRRLAVAAASKAVVLLARSVTAVRGRFDGIALDDSQRIYFANHSSHGDFVLVWTVLPPAARRRARPVAAAEYWLASGTRCFLARQVFDAVLIDRDPAARRQDPVELMIEALDGGSSLVLFPEGTRNTTEASLLPFRSGLYHLARARPGIDLVPVWIDNLGRVMPKGGLLPVPMLCTVAFGAAMRLLEGETKEHFLAKATSALAALSPRKAAA